MDLATWIQVAGLIVIPVLFAVGSLFLRHSGRISRLELHISESYVKKTDHADAMRDLKETVRDGFITTDRKIDLLFEKVDELNRG